MSDLTYFCRTFTLLTMNSPQVYLGALRVRVTHAHKHARLADHARALWGIIICSSHIISLCRSPTPGAIVSLAPLPGALLPASGIIDHPDCHNACSDCGPGLCTARQGKTRSSCSVLLEDPQSSPSCILLIEKFRETVFFFHCLPTSSFSSCNEAKLNAQFLFLLGSFLSPS